MLLSERATNLEGAGVDDHPFDDLVRSIAATTSRRRLLGGLGAALLSAVGFSAVGSAATPRRPGQPCQVDANCVAGARCRTDARGRRTCVCDTGTKACGNACIPASSCCKDAECRALNTPCAKGVCAAGTCQTRPRKNGTACPDGVCCDGGCVACCKGIGRCTRCTKAVTCPGQDTPCRTRICVGGFCGIAQKSAGAAIANQTLGDCKKQVCNGAGAVVSVNDNTDLPADDGNRCTAEVCANGTPGHSPRLAGTPCDQNGGTVCDGRGRCVACLIAADCPGQDTECQHRVCDSGACGFAHTASGTPLSQQTAGDCKRTECDGLGGTIETTDDGDLPDDGNPCTRNVCTAGVPSHPFAPLGTSCGEGLICDGAGACVGCITPADCPGQDSTCQTRTCSTGVCGFSFATSGTACGENRGTVCNGSGACAGCQSAADCPGQDTECRTRTCTAGACGYSFAVKGTVVAAQTPGDCKHDECDGSGNVVRVIDDTDLPTDGNPCTLAVCNGGVVSHPFAPLGTSCGNGLACREDGVCGGCSSTADCPGADRDCRIRTCTAGVCGFADALAGTACNGGGDVCDGSGNCVAKPPAGQRCSSPADCPGDDTECRQRTCIAGQCGVSYAPAGKPTATQTAGDCKQNQCDGNGALVAVDDPSDAPATGNQCFPGFCSNGLPSSSPLPAGTECNQYGGVVCDGSGTCIPQKFLGSPCTVDAECTSGFCADGVCCDARCQLPCRACTAALKGGGEDGRCGPILAGLDPNDECPGTSTCNGNGTCTA